LDKRPLLAGEDHRSTNLAPSQIGEVDPLLKVDGVRLQDLQDSENVVLGVEQRDISASAGQQSMLQRCTGNPLWQRLMMLSVAGSTAACEFDVVAQGDELEHPLLGAQMLLALSFGEAAANVRTMGKVGSYRESVTVVGSSQ